MRQLDHPVDLQRDVRVDHDVALPGEPVDGRPDQRRQVLGDGVAAHRAALQPPLRGVLDEPDDAVGPGLGGAGVQSEGAQVVAEQRRERRRDDLLVRPDDLLAVPVARQHPVEVGVLLERPQHRVDRLADARERGLLGVQRRDQAVEQDVRRPLAHRLDQVGLVREVSVEHRLGAPGLDGDLLDPELRADLGQHPHRGLDELGPPLLAMPRPASATPVTRRGRSALLRLDTVRHGSARYHWLQLPAVMRTSGWGYSVYAPPPATPGGRSS